MLEARNLVKVYKPKKGVPVKALDNISLKFPKTGMIFILGKSGSGKSTLLNVLGGLDGFTSGDILVKGQTTKQFKQSSYDSYRNTYVGFIFQEYNVLDDFTVGANIALAIELQGRKATNEELNEILEEVDLVEYGNRKPNELSGGQKQRVAIARALVKKPEIIMADEPTGALDSVTGRQIFDTLKELSKEKLVMVVSHDREFAETYADRIIELADGKVISDVTKNDGYNKEEKIENISFSNKSISIKQGYQLTEEDLVAINRYLANLKTNATINLDVENKSSSKFTNTNEESIETDNSGFKIGASGLKHKKFKLVMTVFLSVIAFTLFGFSDTFASYDIVKTTTSSLIDSDIDYASFVKREVVEKYDDYIYYKDVKLSDDDLKYLKDNTDMDFVGVYKPAHTYEYGDNIGIDASKEDQKNLSTMFPSYFQGIVEFDSTDLSNYGYSIVGNLPDGSKREIAISKYAYEFFKETSYFDGVNKYLISNENDLIGKKLTLDSNEYTITGIIDTGFNYERYRKVTKDYSKMTQKEMILAYALASELQTAVEYSLHSVCFVGKKFIENFISGTVIRFTEEYDYTGYMENDTTHEYAYMSSNYISSKSKYDNTIHFFDSNKTTLENNEIAISKSQIKEMINFLYEIDEDYITSKMPTTTYKDSGGYDRKLLDGVYLKSAYDTLNKVAAARYVDQMDYDDILDFLREDPTFYEDDKQEYEIVDEYYDLIMTQYEDLYIDEFVSMALDVLDDKFEIKSKAIDVEFNEKCSYTYNPKTMKIVGIADNYPDDDFQFMIVSDKFYEEELTSSDGILSYAVSNMPTKRQDVRKLVEFAYAERTDNIKYELSNTVTFEINMVAESLEIIAKIFFWIGFAFAIFASLMLSNFIANSISYKKQDIGILRAIGSRSSDVFRIFFAESFVIAIINYVITMTTLGIIIVVINASIRKEVGLLITMFTLGIRQFAVMLAICLLVAAIATFLPVNKHARKKPIDAIRGR